MKLTEIQQLLYRLVTAPNGVAEGLQAERMLKANDLDTIIIGDERLSASQRVDIYANAYFYRLLDVCKEDYPAVLKVIGDDNFHNLITGYLTEYPPTEPSIYHAGSSLASYLATHPFAKRWPFISDVARVERMLIEVFHAPDLEPLDATVMNAIAPDQWGETRLRLHPAAFIIDLDWHVESIQRAVETEEPWRPPSRGPLKLMAWRKSSTVFYREPAASEIPALALARHGTRFSSMCEAIADATNDPEPVAIIRSLLGRWLNDGILTREL